MCVCIHTNLGWFNYHRTNHYKQVISIQLLSDLIGGQYRSQIFDSDPVLLDNYTPRLTGYNLPVKNISQRLFC